MAKNFGKFVLFSAIVGAAAAGAYYYLQKSQDDPLKDIDDIDDFDAFDDEFDDDAEEAATAGASRTGKNRSYVSLDLENAKEVIGEKVIETIDKAKEIIEEKMIHSQPASGMSQTYSTLTPDASVDAKVEEFFDDTTADTESAEEAPKAEEDNSTSGNIPIE